jgi:hypothetical protein
MGIALFFALIAGIGVAAQWREWILFTNRVDFNIADPQFGRDVGFYVFQLPFIKFIIDWLFAGLVIVLLVTSVAHYLNGGIRFQSPLQRVTPQVKAHISVILALMALVKTADYFFSRFELNFSDRGAVDGATYTDINAQLPALEFLTIVSVIAALLFLWNIWRRGWVLPVIAVGLWAFLSLIVGTIYPAAIQNFKVNPDEFATERDFIERNIEATRDAFGLSNVDVKPFNFTQNLESQTVETNLSTIDNARLWDPDRIEETYTKLQGFSAFYNISDVDIDRYTVDGQIVQVMVSARNINSRGLPSQSWVNEHLIFTHGYGAISSPSNAAVGGDPLFLLSDIPTRPIGIELRGKGAQIYFGEGLGEYVIVGGNQPEFNFTRSQRGTDARTRYKGDDGVELSNIIRRAAFALRFGDPNPLISGQVNSESKVLLVRDVQDRVAKVAPFLSYDADPYPAIVDNRLLWIVDAYTTSTHYPYSQMATGVGGLDRDFNYIRNSVKVTVDAYDGTMTLYVIDPDDPIVSAYRKAFPDLFTPGRDMPDAVREHLRYPEDLFTLQSEVFSRYHVSAPLRFYQANERWLRTPDPGEAVGATSGSGGTTTRGEGRAPEITSTSKRQDPYYLYIRLPEDDSESFLMMQPFVPVSEENEQIRLASFMTAKSDPDDYGTLEVFEMPKGSAVRGPVDAANSIQSDQGLAEVFRNLRSGSAVLQFGNVQLIPVGESVIYIQPIYVKQEGQQGYPQYRGVIVFTQGDEPVIASTVAEGLNSLFGLATPDPVDTTEPTGPTEPEDGQTVAELLSEAAEKFREADDALRNGELAEYERLIEDARALVDQALELVESGESTSSTNNGAAEQARAG